MKKTIFLFLVCFTTLFSSIAKANMVQDLVNVIEHETRPAINNLNTKVDDLDKRLDAAEMMMTTYNEDGKRFASQQCDDFKDKLWDLNERINILEK